MIDKEYLRRLAVGFDVALDDTQLSRFDRYAEMLVEWNEKMNLTGITDPADMVLKHFADSLSLLSVLPPDAVTLIDVGTGAGFPGVPLAIASPALHMTLLDSLQKRLRFLDVVCEELELSAVTVHARAEDGGHNPALREHFDVATARAVAALPTLCEYCLPFVKPGGVFVAMKGPESDAETNASKAAAAALSGRYRETASLLLDDCNGEQYQRRLIVFDKSEKTPARFPRDAAKIKRAPLG
ncbi:MAG: 16S rRNA (guanine(527)-N(7))-methyltransferase RsmG [Clostridia bacterium]|nr:16S rRNA (guanine(527)-N(7))-methyltransferase RsmG [Clostridia bacterium]